VLTSWLLLAVVEVVRVVVVAADTVNLLLKGCQLEPHIQ
jgi:hypothetical protein